MDHTTELDLIDELLELKAAKSPFMDEAIGGRNVEDYLCPDRFDREEEALFKALPVASAHASELPEAGCYLRVDLRGLPVLLVRGRDQVVRAFLNVCRHRGARLVGDNKGCAKRLSCPYHAWTYSTTGDLVAAPHWDTGFSSLDKSDFSLVELPCSERHGFIWTVSQPGETFDFDDWFSPMASDLDSLAIAEMRVAEETTETYKANWKILVEGGIESYHFKIAHRKTIGPYFEDNLSSYQIMAPHMRSILPRVSMRSLAAEARETWRLRDHANVLYTLFPTCQLLVQQDHIVWIRSEPLSADRSRLRLVTLVPKEDERDSHWAKNHEITMTTLNEDFDIGEGIQAGLESGANTRLNFGRFEGALADFNATIDGFLDATSEY